MAEWYLHFNEEGEGCMWKEQRVFFLMQKILFSTV